MSPGGAQRRRRRPRGGRHPGRRRRHQQSHRLQVQAPLEGRAGRARPGQGLHRPGGRAGGAQAAAGHRGDRRGDRPGGRRDDRGRPAGGPVQGRQRRLGQHPFQDGDQSRPEAGQSGAARGAGRVPAGPQEHRRRGPGGFSQRRQILPHQRDHEGPAQDRGLPVHHAPPPDRGDRLPGRPQGPSPAAPGGHSRPDRRGEREPRPGPPLPAPHRALRPAPAHRRHGRVRRSGSAGRLPAPCCTNWSSTTRSCWTSPAWWPRTRWTWRAPSPTWRSSSGATAWTPSRSPASPGRAWSA